MNVGVNRVREKQVLFVGIYLLLSAILVGSSVSGNRPPRFIIDEQTEIVVRLKEGPDTPVGTFIYRLRGADPDGDVLTFGVQGHGHDVIRIENLNSNEANIYLNKELDREVRDEYSLVLTLTDGHIGEGNFITQSLLILVEDVNDNEPIFKPYQPSINVREDSGPGVLTTVEATDADEGPYGQVVYHLENVEGDEKDLFSISTVNGKGVIKLVGKLDYETKFLHQLKILAVDRSNNDRRNTGTAAILVKVVDVEDQPPEFVAVSSVTRVSEDVPVGTSVLQVKAVDGDRGINNKIIYSISSGSLGIFDIDPNSGNIFTLKELDRESATSNNGAYILEIKVTEESAVRPAPTAKTEVTIIVTDVNDETPTFRSPHYVAEIHENSVVNTPVTFLGAAIPTVFDYDQGKNGTFQMFIDGDQGTFEITPQKIINEASFLIRVKNSSRLDYEAIKVINFTLIAKEIVQKSPKYSSVPVTILIRDVNDNSPEFSKKVYEVSVAENAVKGTTVAKVQAFDEDTGVFGTEGIRYTGLGGSVADMLKLDPVSGILTVNSETELFDREQVDRHFVTAEARDELGFGNRNTVQIIINVLDKNDNAPTFLQNKYEARLLENKMDFEIPLIVEATDMDQNGTDNSAIYFSIIDTSVKTFNFTIDPVKGIIRPMQAIDFEHLARIQSDRTGVSSRSIKLYIKAQDMGTPSLSSKVLVNIYVEDVNDNSPTFEHGSYQCTVSEDLPGGSTVIQVTAVDLDASSPNNLIAYRIQSGAQDKFIIDAGTGIISVSPGANLDPDLTENKTSLYSLEVLAIDGGIGREQRHSQVKVNISIEDVNNKPPVLLDPGQVYVKENTPVGTIIHKIVAVDPDLKPVLRYKIDANNSEGRNEDGTIIKPSEFNYLSAFDLNSVDGKVKIIKILDREKVETIKLGLIVEDLAGIKGKQTATGTLTIIVEDENDNSPVFKKPFYKRSITENSKMGINIANVVAEDKDKNRTIKYSLEAMPKIRELISLDEDTGEIVVANKIDHEQHKWLNLSVRATDSGVPPRSSYAEVFIQVLDENDNNPYFVPGTLNQLSIREDTPLGTKIATIEARDEDSGDYGKITYLLDRISSHGKFQIHPSTGVLNVSDHLDREEQSSYMLIVEAWDNYQYGYMSGESRNAFKQILINIIDVNDEKPKFDKFPESCILITEFHEPMESVYVVKAVDRDDPNTPNGKVKFDIVAGNVQGLFNIINIDYSSARIVTTGSLKMKYGNYTLRIQAQDLGTPPNIVYKDLPVCVTDYNDNAPRFVSPSHNVTIRVPENATVGSAVITVEATDDDIGQNAQVQYRLKQDLIGDFQTFSIDPNSGLITLRQPLNREKQKLFQIRVEAYDQGVPTPLTSDLDLTIYVRGVNDYQPQFLIDEFTINFTEHQKAGSERYDLVTVDRDDIDILEKPSLPVCYYIISGNENGFFHLEPLSHKITTMREIDREEQDKHVLIVKASEDCINPPRIEGNIQFDSRDDTLLRLVINVLDINDNAPKFVHKVFTGGVTAEADFGTELLQVKAIDKDQGINARVKYFIIGPIRVSLSEGMENIPQPPFLLDEDMGTIFLNFDPQKSMKGYFDFILMANDTGGLSDTAKVMIYLLREDQKVKFVLRQNPPELREKVDLFRSVLGNVTGAIVNVDECKVHETKDGKVDKTRTDLYLHFVDPGDHSVMEVDTVLKMIDLNIEQLDGLFKDFNVLDTQGAEALPILRAGTMDQVTWLWFAGVITFLILLIIVIVGICVTQRKYYQRQIKAATVTAFGSTDSSATRTSAVTARVIPNTNIHSVEGSNPMWLQSYENEWYKETEEDSLSQASERDSLDENVVTCTSAQSHDGHDNSDSTEDNSCNSRSNIIKISKDTLKLPHESAERKSIESDRRFVDTSKTDGRSLYHENIYNHLNKLSNPLMGKKLETTEL
uniref:Cadherin-23 n=1 Tax=Cacopsylla melanoneura TaxID=428564 RepID=A0A8D8Q5N3_9HEMI